MEYHHATLAMMAESHWEEVDDQTFAHAWNRELEDVPTFTDSTVHIVAGLLLPVWKRLPTESTRVYRLQTDDGERIIGRRVSPAWAANAATVGVPALTGEDAYVALIEGRAVIDLAEGLGLLADLVPAERPPGRLRSQRRPRPERPGPFAASATESVRSWTASNLRFKAQLVVDCSGNPAKSD